MALFSRRPKKPADSEPTAAPETPSEDATPAAAADERATDASAPADATTEASASVDAGEHPETEAASEAPADADAAASVSISVSSFGGLGAAPARPTPSVAPPRLGARAANEVAPAPSETIPGLRDNVLLREALARVPDGPPSQTLLDVARQLLQGHVFLRVKGDARTLLSEGKDLPLAVATVGERTFGLVYSSGEALHTCTRARTAASTRRRWRSRS